MNFFGHAVVAHGRNPSGLFLLGAMLPDFEGMAGQRVALPTHGPMTEGVAFHHDTDRAFHGAPVFCGLVAAGVRELTASGLSRGTARAVAHVGIELLLDGELSRDPCGPGDAPFRHALAVADAWFAARPDADERRLRGLLQRLADAPIPARYGEPSFVAERLHRMLAPRPRLALPREQVPVARAFLARMQPTLRAQLTELLTQLHDRLGNAAEEL